MKKAIYRLIALAVVLGGGWYGYRYFKSGPEKTSVIATTKVQRGDVVIRAFTRGELKAVRVYPLYAPNLNGTVQVTQLAPMGSLAKEKDLIVEYDDSELLASIDSDKLNLDSSDESIKSQQLQMEITKSQDQVRLLSAQYAVRRAELKVQQKEVINEIDGKKNDLSLEESIRTLDQQKTDIEMRKAQQDSQLAVLRDSRNRSQQEYQRDLVRLTQTKTLAPMSGLVSIKQNRGGNFNYGMQMPDIRAGDQLQAGMNVADLLDLSEMELSAKVGELDRANLQEGQAMSLQLDSIPDKRFPGKIKTLSGTATADVFSGDPSKKFDVSFAIDMRTLLTGLGMKPADVDRIMNTAVENAKKNLVSFAPTMGGGRGGGPGGGGPGGGGPPGDMGALDPAAMAQMAAMQRGQGGGQGRGPGGDQAGGQGRGQGQARGQGGDQAAAGAPGQGRGGFMSNMSDEDRQKLADLRQKLQTATGDERDKLQAEQTAMMQRLGLGRGRGQGGDQAGGAPGGAPGGFGQGRGQAGDQAGGQGRGQGGDVAGGFGFGQGRGQGGGQGGGQGRGQGGDQAGGGAQGRGQGGGGGRQAAGTVATFTDAEREAAKLPLPPEQDSDVAVLLRPGLLADVEIEVEKIPNAIHVPSQAVFTKGGQPTVYVQGANGRFSARVVKLVKQSESMMVLESGVEPGELVALADPTASKSEKNKTDEKKSTSATSMMPGGGK